MSSYILNTAGSWDKEIHPTTPKIQNNTPRKEAEEKTGEPCTPNWFCTEMVLSGPQLPVQAYGLLQALLPIPPMSITSFCVPMANRWKPVSVHWTPIKSAEHSASIVRTQSSMAKALYLLTPRHQLKSDVR